MTTDTKTTCETTTKAGLTALPSGVRERLEGGDALWIVKGFGPGAPVRVIERGVRR